MSQEKVLDEVMQAIIRGDSDATVRTIQTALELGLDATQILQTAMTPAMHEVGQRMSDRVYFIPEVLISARAMQNGVELLNPHLGEGDTHSLGTVVIGTVRGDLHDIGKNLVALMLQSVGFNVVDLGIDVSSEAYIKAVIEHRPQIVAMSAILTTTMLEMQDIIRALIEAGLRDDILILVGGAPVSEQFASEIGADGTAPECGSAAELAKWLVLRD